MINSGTNDKKSSGGLRGRFSRFSFLKFLKWLTIVLVIIALIPLTLTIVYRFEAVHPVSALMVTNKLGGKPVSRLWVDIDDVAPALKNSVLMSEDGQFCNHYGVDLGQLKSVIEEAIQGEATRGASTITMQLAKNLFLWNSRSYVRKVAEIPLALWIEIVMPKKRIMEIYLNIAEWGPGIYGIDQASGFHFGKTANQLTNRQAALLAVTLPNPYARDPAGPSPALNRLASLIERRAKASGAYIGCLQ